MDVPLKCLLSVNPSCKRLAWALAHQNDTFDDVIWSEEISLLSSLSEVRSVIVLAICVNDTWQQKTGLNGVAQFAALVNAYESVIKIIVF